MNFNILRENDIRGEYPTEINAEAVTRIGKAFACYLKEINVSKCIVGHDNRLSSNELNEIHGGGGISLGLAIFAGITFLIGVIDGYVRPLKCN